MKEIRDKLSIITEDLTNKALLIIQFKGVTVRGRGGIGVRGSLSGGRQILALRAYALQKDDQDSVRNLLDSIALDGRIASTGDGMVFKKGAERADVTLGGGSELTDKMVGEEKKSEINR